MKNQEYTVKNNEAALQFEINLEGEKAYLTYRFYKKNIAFMHTTVPEVFAGKGVASALAVYAFEYAKTHKKLVMVYCPFVAKFIKKHTEYLSQIDQTYLGR